MQGLDLRALGRNDLRNRLDRGGHERLKLVELAQLHPLRALGEDEQALVGHLDDLVYGRKRAHRVQIAGLRGVHARIALRHHHHRLFVAKRLDELDRALPAYRQGQNGMGKQDRIPYGQYRQDPPPAGGSPRSSC